MGAGAASSGAAAVWRQAGGPGQIRGQVRECMICARSPPHLIRSVRTLLRPRRFRDMVSKDLDDNAYSVDKAHEILVKNFALPDVAEEMKAAVLEDWVQEAG